MKLWSHVQAIRRIGPLGALSTGLLALGLAFFIIFLVTTAILPPERTVTVEARTWKAAIVFSGDTTGWTLVGAKQCRPNGPCPPDCAGPDPCGMPTAQGLRWPTGASAELVLRDDGVVVTAQDVKAIGLPEGSRFFFPSQAFATLGVQAFTGTLSLGEIPRSGRREHLSAGRYEFRQRSFIASKLGRKSDIVLAGTLTPGDLVVPCILGDWRSGCRLAAGRPVSQVTMSGIIALSTDPDQPGLVVTATSRLDDVALFIAGFGRASPEEESRLIRPDWVDAVIASPTFLAVTLILTYLASILQGLMTKRQCEPEADAGKDATLERPTQGPEGPGARLTEAAEPAPIPRKEAGGPRSGSADS